MFESQIQKLQIKPKLFPSMIIFWVTNPQNSRKAHAFTVSFQPSPATAYFPQINATVQRKPIKKGKKKKN